METITKQKIPLLDLQAQYQPIEDKIKKKLLEIFDSKYFINGPDVNLLEKKIANYCGTEYAIGVSSD